MKGGNFFFLFEVEWSARSLDRTNVEIPWAVFLNTRLNNSAHPEQSLNLTVYWILWWTLHFFSMSHKKQE